MVRYVRGVLVVAGDGANQPAVISGGPAAKAGIKEGDIVTHIDSQKIDEDHSIISILRKYKPGDTVTIKLLRNDKEIQVSVKLGELK